MIFLNFNNDSLLHIAINYENIRVCKFLIKNGIDINVVNYNGLSSLQLSIDNKLENISLLLIENPLINLNLNYKNYEQYSILQKSIIENSNFIEILIEKGADINYINNKFFNLIFFLWKNFNILFYFSSKL